MTHLIFLLMVSFFCATFGQQHDSHVLVDQIGQELAQKGLEYLEQAWEQYKKDHPDSPGILGNCLEFTLGLTQEVKKADDAYAEFERTRPNRITLEYTNERLRLEEKKHILHFALIVDVHSRAVLLKKACEKIPFINR